jgi:DMSO/TMAO reductase YedYZ heme-binding membrane subunit
MARTLARTLEGPRLVALAALAVVVMLAVVAAAYGTGQPGVSAGIRWTARSSFLFFLPTFIASALVTLHPAPATKWLLRNRRYLGLSLAASHGFHLVLIVALAALHTDHFVATSELGGQLGGGAGFVLLLAMTVTSTDRAQARLGRRRWRALHLTGMVALWAIFTFTYLGRTLADPAFAPALVALVMAAGLRGTAWWRVRRRRVTRMEKLHTSDHA